MLHADPAWAHLLRNAPGRVVCHDRAVFRTVHAGSRGGGGRRGLLRRHSRPCRTRCRFGRLGRRAHLWRTPHGGRRRVQQYGVLTQQTAIGPIHLDEEIHKGFANRELGRHQDHRVAFRVKRRLESEQRQIKRPVDPRTLEGLLIRQFDANAVQFFRSDRKQRDIAFEILVQGRFGAKLPQPQSMNRNTQSP